MGSVPQILGYVAALLLQLLIINLLLRGAWRQYPFLFVYVLADFVTNLMEIQPNLEYDTGSAEAKRHWAMLYWVDERIIQALLFLLVISLIYRASAHLRPRRTLVLGLVVGSVLFAGISVLSHYSPEMTTGRWMTRWTRDMNFCAAVLDLGLWAMLIRAREKDYRLLLISGALGIQFTAGAIGQALRDISHDMVPISSILIVCANLTSLYIWWQALKLPERARKAPSK
jgi:hypothetical protein